MLLFLESFEVLGGIVFDECGGLHSPIFNESVGGSLFRDGSLLYVRSRSWQAALCSFLALILISRDEFV